MLKKIKPQYRIVGLYLLIGFLWISFSDAFMARLFLTTESLTKAQNIKGWTFIFVTGGLLFFLIQKDFNQLKIANQKLIESYDQAIRGWVQIMDLRHKETQNHTERVTQMAVTLSKLVGIHQDGQLKKIEWGALLHDIGKIGIPDSILTKPGSLTKEEWIQIRTHPEISYKILDEISYFEGIVDIPYCHHEKWDGTGYPQGLQQEEIPLPARIFAIVDVWDALIHRRVYKPAWNDEEVKEYIKDQAGQHFDPQLVNLFLKNYDQVVSEAGTI